MISSRTPLQIPSLQNLALKALKNNVQNYKVSLFVIGRSLSLLSKMRKMEFLKLEATIVDQIVRDNETLQAIDMEKEYLFWFYEPVMRHRRVALNKTILLWLCQLPYEENMVLLLAIAFINGLNKCDTLEFRSVSPSIFLTCFSLSFFVPFCFRLTWLF